MRASSGCVNHRGCVSVCLRVGMFAGKAGLRRVAQGRRYKPFPRFEKVNFIV